MKVLHFILGKANKDRANGVNQVIAGLAKYSARLGIQVRVIGKAQAVTSEGELVDRDGFTVEAYSRWGRSLRAALSDAILWADIVHLHGVYSPWNLLVARMCEKLDRPYTITLHDGLAPDRALVRGRLRKRIFQTFFQLRHLENAAGIHILTEEEGTDLFAMARPRKVFCIPNGVDLDDYPEVNAGKNVSGREITIGYLGRLSAEKNLQSLCDAFVGANIHSNLRLKLAGPKTAFGEALLAQYVGYSVEWVGPKFGQEKTDFIRSLDLFVHPSLCDVFSIAAMEVLALGTPLLITRTSNVSYFYNQNAFYMCEPTIFGLKKGLQQAILGRDKWVVMARNGRDLIESRLNWGSAARDMLKAYELMVAASK